MGDGRHRQIITSEIFFGHNLVKEWIETEYVLIWYSTSSGLYFSSKAYIYVCTIACNLISESIEIQPPNSPFPL